MKLSTREKLFTRIQKRGPCRPKDLAEYLELSNVQTHHHLNALMEEGRIEPRGSSPFTTYVVAGKPDFFAATRWVASGDASETDIVDQSLCSTRDVFVGRIERLTRYVKEGLKEENLPLVIAVCGEVGNNSFDHNLGKWIDQAGCWFQIELTEKKIWVLIADRGQGVMSSLQLVRPQLSSDQEALRVAFEERVSARAPERRGNGLKFVREGILDSKAAGVACVSGSGSIHYGERGEEVAGVLQEMTSKVPGTATLLSWELK